MPWRSRARRKAWWTSRWPSREIAEEKTLAICQRNYGEACVLLVVNDTIVPPETLLSVSFAKLAGVYVDRETPVREYIQANYIRRWRASLRSEAGC